MAWPPNRNIPVIVHIDLSREALVARLFALVGEQPHALNALVKEEITSKSEMTAAKRYSAGMPEIIDYGYVENKNIRKYLTNLPRVKAQNFRTTFSHTDASVIDLLEKLLVFNLDKRLTAVQALHHLFFNKLFNAQDILKFALNPN